MCYKDTETHGERGGGGVEREGREKGREGGREREAW